MKNILKLFQIHKKTLVNITWRTIQVLSKQGVSFLIFFLSSSFLSLYDFGVYSYLVSFLFFLAFFSDFGISMAVVKYISQKKVKNKYPKIINKIIFNSLLIILLTSTIIMLFSLMIGPFFLKNNYQNFLYLLPLIFLVPFTSVCDGIFRAEEKFKKLATILIISGLITLPLSYIMIKNYGIKGAFLSQDLLYFSQFLILLLNLKKDISFEIDYSLMREILKYSLVVGFSAVGYLLFSRLNTIILGKLNYIVEVGYYEIINKIVNQIIILPYAIIVSVIAPMVGNVFYGKNGQSKIIIKIKKWGVFAFLSASLLSLFFYFIFPFIIKSFFPKYQNETVYFMAKISLIVFPFGVLSYLYGNGFAISTGYAKLNLKTTLISGIINLIVSPFFLYFFGFQNFFISTTLVSFFASLYFIIKYFYLMGILKTKNGA